MGKILLQSMDHIVHGEEKAFTSASEILLLQMQKRCQLSSVHDACMSQSVIYC